MVRISLPHRRMSVTHQVKAEGVSFTVTVGFDETCAPNEVFADGAHGGSTMSAIISDACVLVSVALQHGITPPELGKSLGRVPRTFLGAGADQAASPLGVIVEVVSIPLVEVVSSIREAM